MSVVIRGMDMPRSCKECRLHRLADGNYICYDGTISYKDRSRSRMISCPLSPEQPHGRLIDGDELYKLMETYSDYDGAREYHDDELIHRDSILFAIEQAATIIPAAVGGERS